MCSHPSEVLHYVNLHFIVFKTIIQEEEKCEKCQKILAINTTRVCI